MCAFFCFQNRHEWTRRNAWVNKTQCMSEEDAINQLYFSRGRKNAWFNKKTTRFGEMTARSTSQPTLEKNKEKDNGSLWLYPKDKQKKKHKTCNRSSVKAAQRANQLQSKIGNCLPRMKQISKSKKQWKLYLKEELFVAVQIANTNFFSMQKLFQHLNNKQKLQQLQFQIKMIRFLQYT